MTDQPIDPVIPAPSEAAAALELEAPPPPPPPPMPMAPTSGSERVEVIDILRGIALFGILAANIRGFAGPAIAYFNTKLFWTATHDRIAQAFVDTFIQGKFITIFAFLFGVGFTIQLGRAEARGAKFGSYYVKRALLLALIGLIHGFLIWFGDILFVYALTGLILLAFRKRKDKTVLTWAFIFYFLMFVLMVVGMTVMLLGDVKPPQQKPGDAAPAKVQEAARNYREGSFLQLQGQRTHDVITKNYMFMPAYMWQLLGLFLFGMYAWRRGFFSPAPEKLGLYKKAMIIGLTLGILGQSSASLIRWFNTSPPGQPSLRGFAAQVLAQLTTPLLSLGYVCAVILLFQSPVWRARMQRFGAVGRTALSNYLLQSVIGTLLFYSYGLGLMGKMGPALLIIPTILIYAAQAFLAPWWLRRYRFGPVEWAWRSLTYGKMQPLARDTVSSPTPIEA